jgi:very-short-patch-repair endonuclease
VNSQWLLIAGALVVLMVIGALTQKGTAGSSEKPRRRWVLTKNEAAMYHRLMQALPDKVILAQVSFGALLTARSKGARNRFDRKMADFVVCDKALQVLAIIELDDISHRGKEGRDAARDKLLLDAGYRVIRYPRIPNAEKVQADFVPVVKSEKSDVGDESSNPDGGDDDGKT